MFIQFTPYLKNEKLLAIRSFEIFMLHSSVFILKVCNKLHNYIIMRTLLNRF